MPGCQGVVCIAIARALTTRSAGSFAAICMYRSPADFITQSVCVCARLERSCFVRGNKPERKLRVRAIRPGKCKRKGAKSPRIVLCVRRPIFFFSKTYSGDCACRVVWCGQGDTAASSLDVTRGAMTPAPETWTNALLPDFLLAGKPLRSHTLRSFSRSKEQAPTPV